MHVDNLTRLMPALDSFDQLEALLETLNLTAHDVLREDKRMRLAALRLDSLEQLITVNRRTSFCLYKYMCKYSLLI